MRGSKSQTVEIDIRPLSSVKRKPGLAVGKDSKRDSITPDYFDSVDFRFMFEHAYDAILMTDFDGYILATNMRAVNFFGYDRSDFPGMDIRSLIPGITDDLIVKIKKGGACGQFMRIQAFAVHKGGEEYSAVEIVPLGNKEAKASYICYLIRDIQSRYIAEENLHSTYHAMDNTDSGIGIINMEGVLIYANRKMVELLGDGNIDDVINFKLDRWFDQKTAVNPMLANVLRGLDWFGEQCVVGRDKSTWLYVSAVPNINRDDELMGAVLSIRDMADERRADIAEYQAERNRIMMESLAGVCHSIGQPATVLLTSLELLKLSGLEDKENVRQMLDLCYEAVIQIRDLLYKMNAKQLYAAEPYLSVTLNSSRQEIVDLESPAKSLKTVF